VKREESRMEGEKVSEGTRRGRGRDELSAKGKKVEKRTKNNRVSSMKEQPIRKRRERERSAGVRFSSSRKEEKEPGARRETHRKNIFEMNRSLLTGFLDFDEGISVHIYIRSEGSKKTMRGEVSLSFRTRREGRREGGKRTELSRRESKRTSLTFSRT